ncbi:DUF2815 family protein [Aerococcus urinae]|uniref:DUF2815 family protein n=1 Tax=Aerococcus urinae TaxID=1376 RepID=UPI0025502A4D|nr:DUF2815 family protein [Aerococcus urinae]MDK6688297.1 DUF2815 family protein [Aerococcus urinae]
MAKLVNNTKVITDKVRLAYAHLLKPYAYDGQEPKYSTMLIISKDDTDTVDAIKKAIKNAYDEEKNGKLKGVKFEKLNVTLRDGDEEKDVDGDELEFKNAYFINVSSKTAPGVVDKYKNKIEDSSEVYSGVYARASINFYVYNFAGNKGVSAGLNNIQIVEKGEFLGGRASAQDDFDVWEDDEELDDII